MCNQNRMIRVKRAFLATFDAPLQTAHGWCDNANHDSSHCKQYESQLTDDFITTCNTRSVCTINQYYTELSDCQSASSDPQLVRRTYIHVEFDCLPRKLHYIVNLSKYSLLHSFATIIKVSILNRRKNYKLKSISFTGFHIFDCCLHYYSTGYDPNDSSKQILFTHVHTGNTQTATASLLYIMSVDYPQPQVTSSSDQTRCVITFPQHTIGSISILDMGYTNSQYSTCPVRIAVLEEYRCAQLGTHIYLGFDLKPSINQIDLPFYDVPLTIQTGTYVSHMKLWLEVSGKLLILFLPYFYYFVKFETNKSSLETKSILAAYHIYHFNFQCR